MTPESPIPFEELRLVFGPGVDAVEAQPLGRAVPAATAGVWLVRSGADVAVLKVVHHDPGGSPRWPADEDPAHPYYWRREACAYETGFLEPLPAPRCIACFDRPDGSVALWLEALAEPPHTIEHYGLAARHLGRMQGAFAEALPSEPWLSRRWLRAYLDLRRHMTVSRSAERATILRAVEAGPQTFCHLDFYPGNLFGDGAQTILIDWAYCGLGVLGEDPGNFVPDAILDGFVAADRGAELERMVWDGYLAGLADAGWAGDERAVRFAFAATPWLKFEWLDPALASGTLDAATEARWRAAQPVIHKLGEEARELASSP